MIQQITSEGVIDQSKLTVVYSGVDLDKFQKRSGLFRSELGIEATTFLVGNTSALADHKDYYTFIDTASKVVASEENVKFVVMGEGPLQEEIMTYAAKKLDPSSIVFTGFRTDIPKILADLDVFLMTSKTEGLGTSLLDAFACKVAVVATAAGGIPELIEHEKTGLLCPIKDADALSKAVVRLKKDAALRLRLAKGGETKGKAFSKRETALLTLEQYRLIRG